MNAKICLNHSSLAKPSSNLIDQMQLYQDLWYQPLELSSTIIQKTRDILYSFVGANKKDHFVFTSSRYKATAQAYISAIINLLSKSGKNHILTIDTEDSSTLSLGNHLKKVGYVQKKVALNERGEVTPETLKKALSSRTGLFSLSWANGYTGVIQPIEELAKICHKQKVLLHIDASNIIGKYHFAFENLPIDYLTFEGSSIHAPAGSGGLFVSQKTKFEPLIPETTAHEHCNVFSFIGLGIACEELKESGEFYHMEIARLRTLLEEGVQNGLQNTKVLFREDNRLPHLSVLLFPGISNELLAFHLKESGVMTPCCRTLEHLLIACGTSPLKAKSAISFILSRETTEKEIRRVIEVIVDCAQLCQTFSQGVIE